MQLCGEVNACMIHYQSVEQTTLNKFLMSSTSPSTNPSSCNFGRQVETVSSEKGFLAIGSQYQQKGSIRRMGKVHTPHKQTHTQTHRHTDTHRHTPRTHVRTCTPSLRLTGPPFIGMLERERQTIVNGCNLNISFFEGCRNQRPTPLLLEADKQRQFFRFHACKCLPV